HQPSISSAVDGRKLRFEDSNRAPICGGLVSTFYSLKRSERPHPMAFAFEKLIVYEKAVDFADQICSKSENFARGYGFLADQLNRAALSISANIAEGNGRFTKPDRKNFFGIARGSVQECVPLLELARRRGLVTAEDDEALKAQLEEIGRMLSGLINGLDHRDE
ncbi:MAG: four helix bundle protein, partial [Planctomyces sp.]